MFGSFSGAEIKSTPLRFLPGFPIVAVVLELQARRDARRHRHHHRKAASAAGERALLRRVCATMRRTTK